MEGAIADRIDVILLSLALAFLLVAMGDLILILTVRLGRTEIENGQDGNQRDFRTELNAIIGTVRTTLFATETAIIPTGLKSSSPGPHYLQLNERSLLGTLVAVPDGYTLAKRRK